MKLSLKHIYLCSMIGAAGLMTTSCEDFLDRQPITNLTPEAYFTSADQVSAYVINYYADQLRDSRNNLLTHGPGTYNGGKARNDDATDNYYVAQGSLTYFAGNKLVPAGKNLQTLYERVRVWNWLLEQVLPKMEAGTLQGAEQYVGEAYFFRALAYYNGLVQFGDLPIVETVLPDDNAILVENSARQPRNLVARFILADLDRAANLIGSKASVGSQRVNREVVLTFKSRVALFEGTFEKYHRGTGRVPGDANWPGASYNQGFSIDQDAEVNYFLEQAIDAAAQVADATTLTNNSHQMNPEWGQLSGWNPYFDMFSTPDLNSYDEILLWRQYTGTSGAHSAAFYPTRGGDQAGLSRAYIRSFLMKDGLPYYASSQYEGDLSVSQEKANRDERLQLFVFGENDPIASDPNDTRTFITEEGPDGEPVSRQEMLYVDTLNLAGGELQVRDLTGYRSRKYVSYDWNQINTSVISTTGCPVFRSAEALLNYIEAYYERYGNLDSKATSYWQQLRSRAGVSTDIQATINATDLDQEFYLENGVVKGDLAVYSGADRVDATLYNIRRERRCEFIAEGMRWDDLKRWRSWDPILASGNVRFMYQGMNIWDEAFKKYGIDRHYPISGYEDYFRIGAIGEGEDQEALRDQYPYLAYSTKTPFIVDGTGGSGNVSAPDDPLTGKYISPLRIDTRNSYELRNGYSWYEAYYLEPLGVQDLTLTATDPTDPSTSVMYQNPNWPTTAGRAER